MKLGKKPATFDKRDLRMSSYYTTPHALPRRPAQFGHEHLIRDFGVLGNDEAGDCVWAGGAHETMIWTAEAGHPTAFSDESVLSDYSAVTGYDPANPETDEGTDVRQAMKYRRAVGLLDAHGRRHKIGAFIALEPGHWEQVLEALYLFGAVGIGIQFPSSAMDQFNTGRPWSYVPGARLEGGHYVPLVAFRDRLYCVTWGKLQPMTKTFYERYCDEAFAPLSLEMLVGGKSVDGFSLAELQQDLRLVAG